MLSTRSAKRAGRACCVLAVAALALALGGCRKVVDDQKLEDQITANLEHQFKIRIDRAVCPTGVDVDPGRQFDCTVTAGRGLVATVRVKILNSDADVAIVAVKAAMRRE